MNNWTPRIGWNAANAELANKPFEDLFADCEDQYCETCGKTTTQKAEGDGDGWERFTCLSCKNSHAVRTG